MSVECARNVRFRLEIDNAFVNGFDKMSESTTRRSSGDVWDGGKKLKLLSLLGLVFGLVITAVAAPSASAAQCRGVYEGWREFYYLCGTTPVRKDWEEDSPGCCYGVEYFYIDPNKKIWHVYTKDGHFKSEEMLGGGRADRVVSARWDGPPINGGNPPRRVVTVEVYGSGYWTQTYHTSQNRWAGFWVKQ